MGLGNVVLRLLAAAGMFGCVLIGGKACNTSWTIWHTPSRPSPTTVAAAPDKNWVVLQDATLECPPAGQVRRLTRAHGSSGDRFLVYLEDPVTCPTVTVLDGAFIGKFSRTFLRMRQGVRIPPSGGEERVFSQLESPRFLWRRLGSDLTWFGSFLLLTMLAIRALWRREPAPAPRPMPARLSKSGRFPVRD
jgi:hypothetical protein